MIPKISLREILSSKFIPSNSDNSVQNNGQFATTFLEATLKARSIQDPAIVVFFILF